MTGLAVFGITGRMGQSVIRALREPVPLRLMLSGALASESSARLGQDAAAEGAPTGVRVTADLAAALAGAEVAMDFSLPQCVAEHARACRDRGLPLLVGATGFDRDTRSALEAAAARSAVLIAPNTSIGIAVLNRLVELAAGALEGYDVEVSEAHHRSKRDAPSGTALALGETVARAQGRALSELAVYDRHGSRELRAAGSIGFAVTRAGDIVGEHTVTFAAAGERIELTHRATDRLIFARGALRAAEWLVGRPPGLYRMADVLGIGEALGRS
jgi:4-hydroxy-tetrahydrodipicolinate reductase